MDRRRLRRGRRRHVCRWARRPTNGRTATSRPASRTPRWCSTRRSSRPTPATSRSRPRTAMAYWQNGKLYIHTGTQSAAQTVAALARWLGLDPEKVVLISEYTGGGFGSKVTGGDLDDHPGAAVEEGQRAGDDAHHAARKSTTSAARAPACIGRDEGRLPQGRPHHRARHVRHRATTVRTRRRATSPTSGRIVSLLYQPQAMRWRGVTVLTNTPPRSAQSAPGGMQGERHHRADHREGRARSSGSTRSRSGGSTAPRARREFGPVVQGKRAARHQRLPQGGARPRRGAVQLAGAQRRDSRSGSGTKVRGVGVSLSCYVGGTIGFDGLLVIKPDGRIYVQSGIGNLGTESVIDVHRVAAEVLGVPWEKCEVVWGNIAEEPAVDLHLRRQPDDARDDAGGACRGDGRQEEAAGDRREESRRAARGVRGRERARVPKGRRRRADARAGRAARDRTRRQVRRPRGARRHQPDDQGVGRGAGRPGPDRRRQGQLSARRRHLLVRGGLRRSGSRRRNRQVRASSSTSPSPTSAR